MNRYALVALLVLGGCTTAAPPSEPPTAAVTPQVIYVTPAPTAAPRATAVPTAEPTPTAVPTAEPTVASAPTPDTEGLTRGLLFLSQGLDFLSEFNTVWEDATDEIGDWPAFRESIDELESIVDGHQLWLSTHDPHPCYVVAHGYWVTAMDEYSDGIAEMQYGLIPPVTQTDIIAGVTTVTDAVDWIDRATESIECGLD